MTIHYHHILVLLAAVITASPLAAASAAKPAAAGTTPVNEAESFVTTNHYVHSWIQMPALKGQNLAGQEVNITPRPGLVEVVVFLATTCIPCQHIMAPVQELEKTYTQRNARFTYVFSHDTLSDTKEFARVFGLPKAVLAGHDLLKAYHDPVVPSIYVGDRQGWLLTRFSKARPAALKELNVLLKHLTVF